ncbi:LytR C-terminal domain-containing protein [Nocardia sp. CNY236]|uniref:LytR C-terminal domain-containing protein n=1 Tax=Nocardia sp. CNY236 TaxID=1169152 RepID=UPI0004086062|nr:LytR C-terminal domain-containing protein [Nocardia sp. CNY236]
MSNPNPTSGGPPLRALAMVLIALAIVCAGLGAMSLSSSDTDGSGATEQAASSAAASSAAVSSAAVSSSATSTSVAGSTTAASTPPASVEPTSAVASTSAAPTTSAVLDSVPVRVLNNSLIAGLAARTASQLSARGWTIVETGNYAGANIPETTVFYGTSPDDQAAAQAIARELGAAVAPKSSSIAGPDSGVTVIVTGS